MPDITTTNGHKDEEGNAVTLTRVRFTARDMFVIGGLIVAVLTAQTASIIRLVVLEQQVAAHVDKVEIHSTYLEKSAFVKAEMAGPMSSLEHRIRELENMDTKIDTMRKEIMDLTVEVRALRMQR